MVSELKKTRIKKSAWYLAPQHVDGKAWEDLGVTLEKHETTGIISIIETELLALSAIYGHDIIQAIHRLVIKRALKIVPAGSTVIRDSSSISIFCPNTSESQVISLSNEIQLEVSTFYEVGGYKHGVQFCVISAFIDRNYCKFSHSHEFSQIFNKFRKERGDIFLNNGQAVHHLGDNEIKSTRKQLKIETIMHDDFAAGGFAVHFQPRIDLKDGRIVGAEALIRWKNKDLGWIGPGAFIPIAEKNGLIHTITPFVIQEVSKCYRDFFKKFGNDFRTGINLSAVCIRSVGLPRFVEQQLKDYEVRPELIEFEITETQVIHQTSFVIDRMQQIRRMGSKLALDDFGTGYSSLSLLASMPLDVLKVDRSFIQKLGNTDMCCDIGLVKVIHSLSEACGLETIAEGIETEAQAAIVRDQIKCPYGQGYFYSKPIPFDEFMDLPTSL